MGLVLTPTDGHPAIKIVASNCDFFAPAANNNEIGKQPGKYTL
jgi:hypothetical protein